MGCRKAPVLSMELAIKRSLALSRFPGKRPWVSVASDDIFPRSDEDVAIVARLRAFAEQKNLSGGLEVHDEVIRKGLLRRNIYIGNSLINLYVKCGDFTRAKQVFDTLPRRDIVSWNTLVTGYTQNWHGQEALNCFEAMQATGLSPDSVTLASVLKACGSLGELEKGKDVHSFISAKRLLKEDVVLGNALVDMYAKCGELDMAQTVFNELPCWDVLTWNALIGGYCQHGQARRALSCYFDMKQKGYCPDSVTFTIILNACGISGQAENGKEVHAEIVQRKLLGSNIILGSALVTMYANVGDLMHAQQVFDELAVRNVISWTTLISGYCDHGYGEKALLCFEQMKHAGFSPDAVTFSCVVTACGVIKALDKGKELHSEIARKGLVCAAVVGNALIDMYVKCNAVAFAWEVFDNLESPDVVSWNTLISGYCQYEHGMEALSCCKRMTCEAMAYNAITTSCILRACGMMGALDFGTQIHARLFVRGPHIDVVLGNALIDMYSKCGQIIKAHEVFDSLSSRDVVSWNILLSGYYENELTEEVFHCLRRMKSEGFCPDDSTFSCVLKASNSIGAIGKGREVHSEIVKSGLSSWENTMLGNDLLNMYAKCGMLGKAQQVLDELSMQDDIPWNSLISGFCEHGYSDQGLQCYERMMQVGVCPTAATFACILRTCAGIGATTKGQMYFETMNLRYGLLLNLEHYTCMVDLFARAGYLNEALRIIEKMPSHDYLPAWCALLSACWKCENPKMAKLAFENVVRLDRRAAVAYAFMIDLFASEKRMGETWISA